MHAPVFRLLCFVAVLVVAENTCLCQTTEPTKPEHGFLRLGREVEDHFDAGQFSQAREKLKQLLEIDSSNGAHWLLLSNASTELGDLDGAIESLQRSIELGTFEPGQGALRLAKIYARFNKVELAKDSIQRAMAAGYRFRNAIARDKTILETIGPKELLSILNLSDRSDLPRNEGWLSDLRELEDELKRVHYVYRKTDLPDHFSKSLLELRSKLPGLQDSEVIVELQKSLASLNDGHTLIYPFGMRIGQFSSLPLTFYEFTDGLFIIDADSGYRHLIGSKIVKIGEVATSELLGRLNDFVSCDNASGFRWVAPLYIKFTPYLKSVGAKMLNDSIEIHTIDAELNVSAWAIEIDQPPIDPSRIRTKLPAPHLSPDDLPVCFQKQERNFWLKNLDNHEVVYAQINQVKDMEEETFAGFSMRLRTQLAIWKPRALVVDLRFNNGGDANLISEMLRTLIWYETAQKGQLFVIMGRNTFSAAQTMLNRIEEFTNARFVGEPSGSRPNRLGNESPFRLKYSGVMGTISSGYHQGSSSRDHRVWIGPDIPAKWSSQDYFSGKDPAFAIILEMLANSKQQEPAPDADDASSDCPRPENARQ